MKGRSRGMGSAAVIAALLLAFLCLALYWPALRIPFSDFDSDIYVSKNVRARQGFTRENIVWAFTTFRGSNWHPLTWFSHMLDVEFFGLDPAGHHLSSLVLHAVNAALLFLLLRSMTGAFWPAVFAAAIFSWHPLRVESVAWVAERKDVLSALFFMLTVMAYIRYLRRPGTGRYLAVFAFFVMGLMSKPMLVTLPFVLLLLDGWPLGRWHRAVGQSGVHPRPPGPGEGGGPYAGAGNGNLVGLILEKAPLMALSALGSALAYSAQKWGGSLVPVARISLPARMANAALSYLLYLRQAIWPFRLAIFYPLPGRISPIQLTGVILLLAGVTGLVLLLARRRPYLAVGWLWYAGMLVPVIGLVQVGMQAMADRYTYLPLIGPALAAAWGGAELAAGWRPGRPVLATAALAILAGLMLLTRIQLGYWRDDFTNFRHALEVTEGNYLAHTNLGFYLSQRGKYEDAIGHFREAIRIRPDEAKAFNNMGVTLAKMGRTSEAVSNWHRAIDIWPGYAEAHNNLGIALAWLGRGEEAAERFREALRYKPDYAEAHNNLGNLSLGKGRQLEAMEYYSMALRDDPDLFEAHQGLGLALRTLGRTGEAVDHFRQAVRLHPGSAQSHFYLAQALGELGHKEEAAIHYEKAARLRGAEQATGP